MENEEKIEEKYSFSDYFIGLIFVMWVILMTLRFFGFKV